MRTNFTIIFIIFLNSFVLSQNNDTIFFDKEFNECIKETANYYRLTKITDNYTGECIDYYISNNKIQNINNYINGKKNGVATWWYENGQKRIEGYYENGIEHGSFLYWKNDGSKDFCVYFNDGKQRNLLKKWDEVGNITFIDGEKIFSLYYNFNYENIAVGYDVEFSPDGKSIAIAYEDSICRIWKNIGEIISLKHQSLIWSVSYSPDNKIIATGCNDNTIKLWNISTGKLIKTLFGHTDAVKVVKFSADSKTVASSSDDNSVKLWNVSSGKEIKSLKYINSDTYGLNFNDDLTIIATTNSKNIVELWNIESGNLINSFIGHTERVNSVTFNPFKNEFATCSVDKSIKIWDIATGKNKLDILGHDVTILDLEYSPDYNYLVSCSNDQTIKIWNANNGKLIKTFYDDFWIENIDFSPDGTKILSSRYLGPIRLWNIESGDLDISFIGINNSSLDWVAFTPDSRFIGNDLKKYFLLSDGTNYYDIYDNILLETPDLLSEFLNPNTIFENVDYDIPKSEKTYTNRFALIIGNENYISNGGIEADVTYALNDARIFKKYAISTLGIKEENIIYLENGTRSQMREKIDLFLELMDVNPTEREFYIYYAGHGLPDENKDAYLMPVDVKQKYIEDAFKLSDLYSKLIEKNPKKVIIFLDACFSGGGRTGDNLIVARSGVRIKPNNTSITGNLFVFAASSDNQISKPFVRTQHGMFTYFLLKAIKDSVGKITLDNLTTQVIENVTTYSITINEEKQTPVVNVSSNISTTWETWKLNE